MDTVITIVDTVEHPGREARDRVHWLRRDNEADKYPVRWLEHMFDELCVRLGFCLRPYDRKALSEILPRNPDVMTRATFQAEDLDPETADRTLYNDIRVVVAESYARQADE